MLLCVYCVCVHAQSWPTLCNYMDRSPRDSSVHGIFQARILKWFPFPSSSGSSQPKDRTLISCISCIGRWILYHWTTWEALYVSIHGLYISKETLQMPLSILRWRVHTGLIRWISSNHCCCCPVIQSCPNLCDPMDCSTPGLPVPHHLLKFAQVHVQCMGDAIHMHP